MKSQLGVLCARRQLLVATAALQRARLVHECDSLRAACQPSRWAMPAVVAGLSGIMALVRPHAMSAHLPGALRGLTGLLRSARCAGSARGGSAPGT
jgi:hypothetical protein